ncbi:MAG: LptF/LptG family permease, partial [Desulfobacterales bacterium]|nr:LptF/LptG family permease [Desulfobacterales bacterium]
MRILDKYVFKSIILSFFACVFVFLFLYVVIDILSHLEDLLKQQVSMRLLADYYLWNLPLIFVQVSAFACLLSVLYTFGKLNHGNEIIAMRSAGLSIFQITKTALIFGLLVSFFVFWINNSLGPRSMQKTQSIKEEMEKKGKRAKDKKFENINNLSMYGLKNRLFFINKFFPSTNTMEGITILEHDRNQNITKKIVANKGQFKDERWIFYQCITYEFDKNGQIKNEPMYEEEQVMSIPETPQEFMNQRQLPELMDIHQLKDYMAKLSNSGAPSILRSLKINLYSRFTEPLTSAIITILGIPFAMVMRRRSTGLSSLGISIVGG